MSSRNQGFQRQSDGKGCFLQLPQELGYWWRASQLFPDRDAWNLLSQVQAWGIPAGSPAEGTGVRTLAHFNQLHACTRLDKRACSCLVRTTTTTTKVAH